MELVFYIVLTVYLSVCLNFLTFSLSFNRVLKKSLPKEKRKSDNRQSILLSIVLLLLMPFVSFFLGLMLLFAGKEFWVDLFIPNNLQAIIDRYNLNQKERIAVSKSLDIFAEKWFS